MSVQVSSESVNVRVTDQLPDGWDDLVCADAGADFFHTSAWTLAARRHYPQLQPVWLTAEMAGQLVGGLAALRRARRVPLLGGVDRLESSLEGTSGGPVVRGDLSASAAAAVFQALVAAYLAQERGPVAGCSISLNTPDENRFGPLLHDDPRWVRRDVPGAVIDLTGGLEQVEMTRMNNNTRNEKNRGLRRGAEVFATNDPRWLDRYYPIYEGASARWGIPPVPLGFLRELLQLGPERTFFTCVKLEEKVIGGHLNLVHGDRVLAWNGVSDPAFARTHFPGTLNFWGDIIESCARGARWLDLGASGGVVTLSGFKKNFGAELEGRGFYVHETAGMKLLRNTRDGLLHLKSRLRPGAASRWHDGQTTDAGDQSGQADQEGS